MVDTRATHPDAPRTLLALPRGPSEELRLVMDRYSGNPFVRLEVWYRAPGIGWRRSPRNPTIRRREAGAVARALGEAAAEMNTGEGS